MTKFSSPIGDSIAVVSGLPRSGTSLIMQMLEAGGVRPLTDALRPADEDNPNGYFEYEPVKSLAADSSWIERARGRAVKVISALLEHLPESEDYKVVFMRRPLDEVLMSQREMLVRRGRPGDPAGDARMAGLFEKHLAVVERYLDAATHLDAMFVEHRSVVEDPGGAARRINRFFGGVLDETAMSAVVDPRLYRRRSAR